MEEDMGGDVTGHLKVWIEKDAEKRLPMILDLVKDLVNVATLQIMRELETLSEMEAVSLKFELGLSKNDYNTLRNWFLGSLPPLFQVQKKQADLKPELEPILDGVMVADSLNKLLIPDIASFLG
jgi:hypothetical protein